MRTFAVSFVASLGLVLAAAACKTDNKAKPATGSGSAPAPGSASAVGSASGSASSVAGSGSDLPAPEAVTLPKGDGTPPKKTTGKFDDAKFAKLAELDFPSFKKSVRNTKNGFDVRFTTPRPKIGTTVTITPCFDCAPMELDKWKARADGLKTLLAEELRNRPDTEWEIGTVDVHGQTVIYTYQVGHFFGKDEVGNPHGTYSDAYAMYFNDGTNQIRVVSEYQDDPVSRADMLKIAPKEDLAKVAFAFFDAFTHAW